MDNKRRNLLKGGLAVGGAAAFVAGYSPKVKEIANGVFTGSSGEKTKHNIHGNSLAPEYKLENNKVMPNADQVVCNTQCMGCWTLCGLRARVDLKQNKVIRISGNPYHPLSADEYLDYNTSLQQAELSVVGENGLENRSTACARGAVFMEGVNSPYRITQPLKRVGKRGEGKWKTIINFASHGSYCGLSYRAGSGAVMNDLDKNSHAKPDWDNCEFILFMGTSPAQSGNPFKRQARQLAKKRAGDNFDYVVVSPRLELTSTHATQNNRWVPVLPGGDLALALAMLRWIIENERFNADYLSLPSQFAMQQAGAVSYCNASHLFIVEPQHPRFGQALTEQDLFDVAPDAEDKVVENYDLVKNAEDAQFVVAKSSAKAQIWVDETVILKDGSTVAVKSALTLLKESCFEHTLQEYAALCGVPVVTIESLAKEFTSHGHKAVAITHGGTMQSNGFYTAWAILLLNVMIGNMNKKGGMSVSGGKFKDFAPGPRYNLATFPDMVKPKGTNLARSKRAYEKSSEFKRKAAQGSPYPARAAWYPFVGGQMSEMITSALQGYPYSLKAWISHMTNPLYGLTGIHHIAEEKLRDPKVLPLFIAVDAFMNETTALADYVVPDTHNFESWGFSTPWAGVPTKTSTARWPVIQSANAKNAYGETICMESFIIHVAKAMGLPGFGENVISDNQQQTYPLNCSEDYFLRAAANIAFDGEQPVNDATQEDRLLSGVERIMPLLNKTLKPEEVLKAATIFCKGGRFSPFNSAWNGENMTAKWKKCLQIWNPTVAKAKNHQNGEHYHGCPKYFAPQFADNSAVESRYPKAEWPFALMSFKSNLMSSITAPLLRLHSIKPSGIVAMNSQDAVKFKIAHGDLVELATPGGKVNVQVMVIDGVMPGTIAIEHGYGHKQLGATGYEIDGKVIAGDERIKRGININDLGLIDDTKQIASPWVDWVCGSAVRQGLPAKITKI